MPRKEPSGASISAQAQQDLVSEGIENFELPKSVVTKIAKSALPDGAKLQKETVLALVKGSTVFINYLAATAHDVAVSKQHKSISVSDIFKALELIEFNHIAPTLEAQFQAYRVQPKPEKGKKANGASASAARTASSSANNPVVIVSNGNPYPNVLSKPSNPYPSLPNDTPVVNGESSSPYTSAPLDLSASANRADVPMDIDDDGPIE